MSFLSILVMTVIRLCPSAFLPLLLSLWYPHMGFRLIVQVLCPGLRFVVAPVSWDEVYICFGYWGPDDFHFNLSSHLLVAFVVAINSTFFSTCFFDWKMLILFKKNKASFHPELLWIKWNWLPHPWIPPLTACTPLMVPVRGPESAYVFPPSSIACLLHLLFHVEISGWDRDRMCSIDSIDAFKSCNVSSCSDWLHFQCRVEMTFKNSD